MDSSKFKFNTDISAQCEPLQKHERKFFQHIYYFLRGGGITKGQVFIQPLPADIEKFRTRISAAFKESHRK